MLLAFELFYAFLRKLIIALAIISGLAVVAMIGVTVVDVVLRIFRTGIRGAYDIVRVAGVIAITCSLPYVTAIKGHIAIEFFYHRFAKRGRLALDIFFRVISLGLFGLLVYQNIGYGKMLLDSRQVMPTLAIPVFWIPWMISFSCLLIFLTVLYHLFHPGKELIKL